MKTVLVAGDLITDVNLVQYPQTLVHHYESLPEMVLSAASGGAWYLERTLHLACADLEHQITIQGAYPEWREGETAWTVRAYMIWSRYTKRRKSKDQSKPVWRIGQFLGCERGSVNQPESRSARSPNPDVVALDDLNLGFRDNDALWPAALKEGSPERVVLKMAPPVCEGKLWDYLFSRHRDRLTVVLPVTALRERGAAISRALSWDSAIEQTVWEFEEGLSAHDLGSCRRTIVHFGDSGVASFTRIPLAIEPQKAVTEAELLPGARLERFLYHPEDLEGQWVSSRPGKTFGNGTIVTAAMVRHELRSEDYPIYVALGCALEAVRANHEEGGGGADKLSFEPANHRIEEAFHVPADGGALFLPYRTAFPHELLSGELRKQQASESDLLRDLTGNGLEYVAAKAAEVVVHGTNRALEAAPKARYGHYITVDRQEIERINAIRGLIMSYRENSSDRRPLSIAVFGPPGSGKSFAIKQLASELFGEQQAILEFNLSQFSSVSDLHTAFHQVRDASVHGQVPLVFWDEFDTTVGVEPLRWLREFLAPMQDAVFQAASITHPFGKAIFVFAGGTRRDFESFDRSNVRGSVGKEFADVKGPDFISRLRGYVNIKGPNPVSRVDGAQGSSGTEETGITAEQRARQDPAYLIRRAILLRATLERFYPQLIDQQTRTASVSSSVIAAFLRVERYLHGARSLEAVVHMSDLVRARRFGIAQLPREDLLRMHVTDDFVKYLHQGQIDLPLVEVLAHACHKAWYTERLNEGWRYGKARDDEKKLHPLMVEYSELLESDKERNRRTARLTHAKLLDIGYEIERMEVGEGPVEVELQSEEEKRIVETEHDIWLRDHLIAGYEWSKQTDDRLALHKDIARFETLSEQEKKLDWAIARSIPEALSKHHYKLVRTRGAAVDAAFASD